MNILLVHPRFPDTFWSFKYALKFVRKKAVLPPLGLLTVASLLPHFWAKRLVDVNIQPLKPEDLEWADYVFIGAMTVQQASVREILGRCREAGVKVVAGGPLFTSEPGKFPEVDHLVLNEAELTLPPFLADLESGCPRKLYSNPGYADIQSSPAPMWELADLRRYASMSIQYSRGCPFNCEFCNVTALFGHQPRTKTPGQIVRELDGLCRLGWREQIFFVDDNFIGNKTRLKKDLLPSLADWRKRNGRVTFYTEASVNLADDAELMGQMARAGFDTVFVGIETPDEAGLAECNKKQNCNRDLVESVKRMQRAGLQVQAGFIVGFDSDTPSIFKRQIDFIQRSGIVTAMVGMLQAPPGTRLYKRLESEGRLTGDISGDNVDGTTNVLFRMNSDLLLEGYKEIMRHIYSPKHYYKRVRTLLREYRPVVRPPPSLARFMAFGRSVVHLGLLGRERFEYWKLLAWAAARRPRLVSQAVTLSIYGHHFRKTCEQRLGG